MIVLEDQEIKHISGGNDIAADAAVGGLGGFGAGFGIGAGIGSIGGPPGALIGGLIGGMLGAVGGVYTKLSQADELQAQIHPVGGVLRFIIMCPGHSFF